MTDNTKRLKIGDLVTWRKASKPGSHILPMGVANCKILAFGISTEGRQVAMINAVGRKVGALVRDLYRQPK